MKFITRTVVPLLLIIIGPLLAIVFWYTASQLDGSFSLLFTIFQKRGIVSTLRLMWGPVFWGSLCSFSMITIFVLFQLILIKFVPGKTISGPATKSGLIPTYKENGALCLLITVTSFFIASYGLHLFSPTIIYDHFGELITTLSLLCFAFCLFLFMKGKFFPSSSEVILSRNPIFDFYWGREFYPRIWGLDVKQLTHCRLGMMSWPLILISLVVAQNSLYGLSNSLLISVGLQAIYIIKFFFWEREYFRSLSVMHDRAGFCLCWGSLVWIPAIYTSPAHYLVHHPLQWRAPFALTLFTLGCCAILIHYLVNRQKALFEEQGRDLPIWGKPPDFTKVSYTTSGGQRKQSLLLASGFFGFSRHFHYLPELLSAFLWSLPALFTHFYPYFYVTFLALSLFLRVRRDDKISQEKYGRGWTAHCQKVPYKIIPYLY